MARAVAAACRQAEAPLPLRLDCTIARKASTLSPPPDHVSRASAARRRDAALPRRALEQPLPPPEQPPRQRAGR